MMLCYCLNNYREAGAAVEFYKHDAERDELKNINDYNNEMLYIDYSTY